MRHLESAAVVSAGVFLAVSSVGAAPMGIDFVWTGTDGEWSNDLLWSGPANEYPHLVTHDAWLSGDDVELSLDVNIALGELDILNGAHLHCGYESVFVDGDIRVSGSDSQFTIVDGPALREVDANSFLLTNDGSFVTYFATLQVDGPYVIENGASHLGSGVIEMNSDSDLTLDNGYIWAWESGEGEESLTLRRTNGSNARLDLSASDSGFIVWSDSIIDQQLPYRGTVGGEFLIYDNSLFASAEGFIGSASSEISMSGSIEDLDQYATFSAPWLDMYGRVRAFRSSRMEVGTLWLRDEVELDGLENETTSLFVDANTMAFDTLSMFADGPNTRFQTNASSVSVLGGGATVITMPNEGTFDLDGQAGITETTVNDGSSLVIYAKYLDYQDPNERFNAVMNLDGDLHIEPYFQHDEWHINGDLLLDGGTYSGRRIMSSGLISGKGTIEAAVSNSGVLEAVGGTLWVGPSSDLDGDSDLGVIRAITGDMVFGQTSALNFTGVMEIGDGEGAVREVVEVDGVIGIDENLDGRGSLSMNSGRLRGSWVGLYGDLLVLGTSQIRASGAQPAYRVAFGEGGVSTIAGTLELDGGVRIYPDATFEGEGLLFGMNTTDEFVLMNGANTDDVRVSTVGSLHVGPTEPDAGMATVGALTLAPTSSFHVDLGGTDPGVGYDRLNVLDNAELRGSLEISTFNGFAPSYGDTYIVLDASSISGNFDSIHAQGLSLGQGLSVSVTDTQVILQITCPPDISGADGVVDVNDLLLLLANWGTNGPGAAIEIPHEVVDVNDLLALLAAWGGC